MSTISKVNFSRSLSPLFLLILWYGAAFFIKAPLILPYPHSVLFRLFELAGSLYFWQSFAFTFLRVIIAFLLSFITGFFLGLLSADCPAFQAFISLPLGIIRVTPVISIILLALFWFESTSVPVFVAVLMALPLMITASQKGFEKNRENEEKLYKAACYGFTGLYAFRYIRLPAALPSIMAASESAFGLCWKVVAAGEVLSLPHFAAGGLMQKSQLHLETADLMAVTLTLILISGLCQLGLKLLLNKFSSKNQ